MPSKKTFTNSDGAVERFFINSQKEQEKEQTDSATDASVSTDEQTEECVQASQYPQDSQPPQDLQLSQGAQQTQLAQKTSVVYPTQDSYDAQQTQVQTQAQGIPITSPPASGEKGLRKERIGLLLDAQLKEDLAHLSKATGSKSLNDFLVTMLTAYAESPESREKLVQYRRLLQD